MKRPRRYGWECEEEKRWHHPIHGSLVYDYALAMWHSTRWEAYFRTLDHAARVIPLWAEGSVEESEAIASAIKNALVKAEVEFVASPDTIRAPALGLEYARDSKGKWHWRRARILAAPDDGSWTTSYEHCSGTIERASDIAASLEVFGAPR